MMPGFELPELQCPHSRVKGGFVEACRPFEYFGEYNLQSCHKYLNSDPEAVFYLADTTMLDKAGWSMDLFGEAIKQTFDPTCAANVISFVCQSVFKPCQKVSQNGKDIWVPSLTCKDDCEDFLSTWNSCVESIQADEQAFSTFQATMRNLIAFQLEFVQTMTAFGNWDQATFPMPGTLFDFLPSDEININPPSCDVTGGARDEIDNTDWFWARMLGRFPSSLSDVTSVRLWSMDYPIFMKAGAMYPEDSSTYELDGVELEVQCTRRFSKEAEAVDCPEPFLPPISPDSTAACTGPCPIATFSNDEYDAIWLSASLPGVVGGLANSGMLSLWVLGTKEFSKLNPPLLRGCIAAGMLYLVVETLPVLILQSDLPCGCDTNECIGENGASFLCVLNRSSPYLLMIILLSLMALLLELYCKMNKKAKLAEFMKHRAVLLSWAFPLFLMVIAFAVEGKDIKSTNNHGLLNDSRHLFSCSMRFDSNGVEWALLWGHFTWICAAIVVLVCIILKEMKKTYKSVKATTSTSNGRRKSSFGRRKSSSAQAGSGKAESGLAESMRRLCRMGTFVGMLQLTSMVTTIWTSEQLGAWTVSSELWLQCSLEHPQFRDWSSYEFELGKAVCTKNDVTEVYYEKGCQSACIYDGGIRSQDSEAEKEMGMQLPAFTDLGCSIFEEGFEIIASCECSCDDMVALEAPPLAVVCLSYLAQSFITCIVGISLGFKKANRNIVQKSILQRSTVVSKKSRAAASSAASGVSSVSSA